MTAALLGLGCAVPPRSIEQAEAAELAISLRPGNEAWRRLVPALYRRTTIRRRGSVLLETDGQPVPRQSFYQPAASPADRGPGTGARSDRYMLEAPALARAACERALDEARVRPDAVTQLVTVSCTGFAAPGLDAALIESLGLARTVERTHIGFMGCHGAINGLRVARALAEAPALVSGRPPRVLLCAAELCSLHLHYTDDPDQVIANALFADGAAAALIAPLDAEGDGRSEAWSLAACGSCLLPGSADAMSWRIGDHGFEMSLSPRVPEIIAAHIKPWLGAWLDSCGLGIGDIASWAIHPGGPRILSTVAEALGLRAGAIEQSAAVLAEHGNMSSATVLFIIERLRRAGARPPCVGLAFGPGLFAEAALFL